MSTATHSAPIDAPPAPRSIAPPSTGRIFLWVFLTLAIAVTWTFREGFFSTPVYEEGDDAANALQIHRAKQFRELHGNYSRWQFHHPGPAFFYAYAAGEWILHDLTALAPAPRNAHLYAGALLQLAFFSAAIALLARHSRQPFATAALAIAIGALHYAHVQRAIYSIWPPDVLMMPFLCFVVACAAVARGDRAALPVLVVTGSFLVHGHVVMPLFVVPMAAIAIFYAWRNWRGEMGLVMRSRAGITALLLLALFLAPLVIDLFAGRDSNAYDVLLHLRFQSDEGKTLFKSFLCYASYFIGLNDPTMFNKLTPTTHEPFVERAWLAVTWLGILAFAAWSFLRRKANEALGDDIRFGRALLGFWLLASALTLVWGMRQDGGFTYYNSHFNHSLVHVIAFAGILALVGRLRVMPRAFSLTALLAAPVAFVVAIPFYTDAGSRGTELTVRVAGLLQADPKPAAPKLITWEVPDADWYESTALARAFQRRGIEFYVEPEWDFMFGADHVFTNQRDLLNSTGVSRWHVIHRDQAPAGAHILNRSYALTFPKPPAIDALPATIVFGRKQAAPLVVVGVEESTNDWAWTDAPVAALSFVAPSTETDLELVLDAAGFVAGDERREQRLILSINGVRVGEERFTDARRTARFRVPADAWNRRSPQAIVLELPDAISPAFVGESADKRQLGLQLHELKIQAVAK